MSRGSIVILRRAAWLALLMPVEAALPQSGSAARTLPKGTVLEIRLRQAVSSYGSKLNSPLLAEVIAPVEQNGAVVLPLRSELLGRIRGVRRVGLGFSRETALLDLEFDKIRVPGGAEQPLRGRVVRVDDAREKVDPEGGIRGIRATDTFAQTLSGLALSAAAFDPMSLLFGFSASHSVFRLPDSSIILPTGTELHFVLDSEVAIAGDFPPSYPALSAGGEWDRVVPKLPYRTTTQADGTPSDLTTLAFTGSREALGRAFAAAGWVATDALDPTSTYGVMRSIVENQGYRSAPMSTLLLDGKEPVYTFAKTLNTFFSRHHLRIFSAAETVGGQPLWTASATYDSGIGFSKTSKTFLHLINPNIDEERAKVVNDLVLTGCVAGVGYLDRPWVPRDAKNSTGDDLRTDGRLALVALSECTDPRRVDRPADGMPAVQLRQAAYLRPLREAFLTLRNDLTRGNVFYQAYSGIRLGAAAIRKSPGPADSPRRFSYGGQTFEIVNQALPPARDLPADPGHRLQKEQEKQRPKSYRNNLMFSISGGLSGYANERFSTQPLTLVIVPPGVGFEARDPLPLATRLERGWVIAPAVTLNTWRYVSQEFSYSRTVTNFRISGRDALLGEELDYREKLFIRRFTYNAQFHLRPNGARFRPFVSAGPALQLLHLADAKQTSGGLLKFAARDAFFFVSAYDFATKPPLEGGGIFQVGFHYGGGAKFQITPRLFLRADYRETLSAQPDFWRGSRKNLQQAVSGSGQRLEVGPFQKHGPLRHQIVTMGIGVSF